MGKIDAKVKYVIDIPEETANAIKDNAMFGVIPDEILWDVTSAIVNGTPLPKDNDVLDKIRAEIERMDYLDIEDGSDGYDKYVDQYDVMKIIDKYKEEGEG